MRGRVRAETARVNDGARAICVDAVITDVGETRVVLSQFDNVMTSSAVSVAWSNVQEGVSRLPSASEFWSNPILDTLQIC